MESRKTNNENTQNRIEFTSKSHRNHIELASIKSICYNITVKIKNLDKGL